MSKIDFVVTWVDGGDPAWLAERNRYLPDQDMADTACSRYRDWGLMRYWFRGVEKFAPWVNRIYFVTWGHCPEWLDRNHPKLTIVKHADYIPLEYLPTYNSNVIELHLHRLPELSERFVLFNDDMFLTDTVAETDFFRQGLPCETARLGQVQAADPEDVFPHTILNNMAVINKYFPKRDVMKAHWRKFFSPKYGPDGVRNLLLLPFRYFSAFYDTHLPTSHLKSTFGEVWAQEPALLVQCSTHRFRDRRDVTHWLMKNWRICRGQFIPRSSRWGKCYELGRDAGMLRAIREQKFKAVCLNDGDDQLDFEACQRELIKAFDLLLPEKSEFER